jgi:hypothetical protein
VVADSEATEEEEDDDKRAEAFDVKRRRHTAE